MSTKEITHSTCWDRTSRCRVKYTIGSLSKPRRRRRRERHQTKDLMSKTIAVHVLYKSLYISLPSSAEQEREMTKFCRVYGTWGRRVIFVFPCGIERSRCIFSVNTLIIKITISSIVIGLKNSYFSTDSLAKLLSDIYVICRLGGPYSEKLRARSLKCCPRPQAEGSIFKPEVTVFHYTDRP